MYGNYMILVDENGEAYLAHHGIKGQKWGVRRFQNPDGTWTEEGKKRYLNDDGSLNEKGKKFQAKQEYKSKMRDIRNRMVLNDEKYDKKRDRNLYGLESGSVTERFKKHIKNEYNRDQAGNKLNQESLNAKREYRTAIGKKKVDTFGMKLLQKSIDETSKENIDDFTKKYVSGVAGEVFNYVSSASNSARNRHDW